MTFGERMITLRKQLKMSQDDLAKKVDFSAPITGRYKRNQIKPSIGVAIKIAEALEVSLDYLAGTTNHLIEKNMMNRITDNQQLPPDDKAHLFALMDAFLRDHKTKKRMHPKIKTPGLKLVRVRLN